MVISIFVERVLIKTMFGDSSRCETEYPNITRNVDQEKIGDMFYLFSFSLYSET